MRVPSLAPCARAPRPTPIGLRIASERDQGKDRDGRDNGNVLHNLAPLSCCSNVPFSRFLLDKVYAAQPQRHNGLMGAETDYQRALQQSERVGEGHKLKLVIHRRSPFALTMFDTVAIIST